MNAQIEQYESAQLKEQTEFWQSKLNEACRDAVNTLNATLFSTGNSNNPMPFPKISFRLRGKCAGQAHYQAWELRFNNGLLMHYKQAFIDQTAAHEVAHLAVMHLCGGLNTYQRLAKRPRPHGKEWRNVMALLGAKPSVTHQFETRSARATQRIAAECSCGKVTSIGKIQAKRLAQQQRRYFCRYCGGSIKLLS